MGSARSGSARDPSDSIAKWVTTWLSARPALNEGNWPDGDIAIGHRYVFGRALIEIN